LYREQLLPQKGGKIPDSAFQVDRLAANRLSKVGISVPDGVLLEQRYQESHYNEHRTDLDILRSIVRLKQTPDGRFTPVEGRFPTFDNEIESTYVIRSPVVDNYNVILPAFRPNFAGAPAIQIPSKLTNNKIFREKTGPQNRPNGMRPAPPSQQLHHQQQQQQHQQFHPQSVSKILTRTFSGVHSQVDRSVVLQDGFMNPSQLFYQSFENGGNQGYIPHFPSLTEIPFTSFICDRSGGLYPDPEAKCQVRVLESIKIITVLFPSGLLLHFHSSFTVGKKSSVLVVL